ncbi:MAG: hypothetical protein ACI9IA_000015 [Enterobacterales bacterium]|jgi:hypothetical protein
MKKLFKKIKLLRRLYQYYLDIFVYGPNYFRKNLVVDRSDETKNKLLELNDKGFLQVNSQFSKDYIDKLKDKIDKEIQGCAANHGQAVYSELQKYYTFTNPFLLDDALLYYATHPDLYSLLERYFNNKVYLADVDLRVIPPTEIKDVEANVKEKHGLSHYSSSHWHYDIRGKQVKVMVYLSDVSRIDSKFMCVLGTHKSGEKSLDYEKSRFEDAEVDAMGKEKVECLGEVGSAYLFDTNIIHRLNRSNKGNVRYSITFYYTTGRHLRELYVTKSSFENLCAISKKMLDGHSMPRINFK